MGSQRHHPHRAFRWYIPVACAAALLVVEAYLQADNHSVHIEEVMAGANGNSKIQFIIIEQEGSGQNRWGPRFSTQSRAQLVFFDATGRETGKFNFPVDPPTGGTLDVLVATEEFADLSSALTPDVLIPPLLNPISGKVCFRANPANNALAAASQSSIAAPTITPEVTSAITSHITNVRDAVSTLEAL